MKVKKFCNFETWCSLAGEEAGLVGVPGCLRFLTSLWGATVSGATTSAGVSTSSSPTSTSSLSRFSSGLGSSSVLSLLPTATFPSSSCSFKLKNKISHHFVVMHLQDHNNHHNNHHQTCWMGCWLVCRCGPSSSPQTSRCSLCRAWSPSRRRPIAGGLLFPVHQILGHDMSFETGSSQLPHRIGLVALWENNTLYWQQT